MLNDPLKRMGMTQMFQRGLADLSKMMQHGGEDVFIKNVRDIIAVCDTNCFISCFKVIQEAQITIDEHGAKASGANVVAGGFFRSARTRFFKSKVCLLNLIYFRPISITFDEPFLFMLRDKITKIIFLFGKIANPSIEHGTDVFFGSV